MCRRAAFGLVVFVVDRRRGRPTAAKATLLICCRSLPNAFMPPAIYGNLAVGGEVQKMDLFSGKEGEYLLGEMESKY